MCNQMSQMQPDAVDVDCTGLLSRIWAFIVKAFFYAILITIFLTYSIVLVWVGYETCARDYPIYIRAKSQQKGGAPVLIYEVDSDRPYLTQPTPGNE